MGGQQDHGTAGSGRKDFPRPTRSELETRSKAQAAELDRLRKELERQASDRRQVEAAFRDSEERYRTIFTYAPLAIAIANLDGKFLEVNENFTRMLGYSPQEARRLSFVDITDPEDRLATRRLAAEIVEKKRDFYELEKRYRKKDGTPIWAIVRATAIRDTRGELKYWLGIIEDISEHKKADLLLQESQVTLMTVLDSIDADVYVADLNTYEILFMNRNMKKSFGDGLVGRKCYDVFRREAQPCAHCTNSRLLDSNGQPGRLCVWEGVNPVTHRHYINYDKAIKWIDGRVVRLQVATDITVQKRMEEEAQRSEKLESIGILAGGIAHDFNNLLAAVMGNISLARREAVDKQKLESLLSEAEKACKRATALTSQLLTFAKGGAPVKKPTAMPDLIRDACGFVLRGSQVQCELAIAEDLRQVDADEGQIGQVLHNLILNAAQAMPGGGSIQVKAENVSVDEEWSLPLEPGCYLQISVRDHGTGIESRDLSRIYDPYFSTKEGGSGLGLTTAYSIIRRHRGHITVESQPGQGSTFTFYLPASTERVSEPIQAGAADQAIPRGRGRILAMDDEKSIRDLLKRMLEKLGYEVETASDGNEALKLYRRAKEQGAPFTALILDLTVRGGMGGVETLAEIRRFDPGVTALVSSGYSSDPVLADFGRFGFCGAIAKPYDIESVAARLNQVIDEKNVFPD